MSRKSIKLRKGYILKGELHL